MSDNEVQLSDLIYHYSNVFHKELVNCVLVIENWTRKDDDCEYKN